MLTSPLKTSDRIAILSTVIAVIAMVLSQLPPIKTWFEKPHVATEFGERVSVTNTLGFIGYNVFLDIRNPTSTAIEVSHLQAEISSLGTSSLVVVDAKTYAPVGLVGGLVPSLSIAIPAGTTWSGMVGFYSPISPAQWDEIEQLRANFQANQPGAVEAAAKMFRENINLQAGEHKFQLVAQINGRRLG